MRLIQENLLAHWLPVIPPVTTPGGGGIEEKVLNGNRFLTFKNYTLVKV